MSSLKDQLFQQYAANGLSKLSAEYRKRYLPKKGERFYSQGVTYEIGLPKVSAGKIKFEISSKIPQADLQPEVSLNDYFEAVKKQLLKSDGAPVSVDMSSIVQEKGGQREEERGYVRLQYCCEEKNLYNDQEVIEESKKIEAGHSQLDLPSIPEVNTLAAKLVLLLIQERTYEQAKTSMQALINANEAATKKFCET